MNAFANNDWADGEADNGGGDRWQLQHVPAAVPSAAAVSAQASGFTVEEGAVPDGFYAQLSKPGLMVEGLGDTPTAAMQRALVLAERLESIRAMIGESAEDQRG